MIFVVTSRPTDNVRLTASVCNAPAGAQPFRHLDPGQPRDWRADPEDGRYQLALVITLSREYDRFCQFTH
jgi:hypothetical protein